MIRLFIFLISLFVVNAYLEETVDIDLMPDDIGISDACTLLQTDKNTTLRFHDGSYKYTDIHSEIFALNNQCDLVLFGFPDQNLVKLWRPFAPEDSEWTDIRPDKSVIQVEPYRFGFSVDVQNQSWVVGAPGITNNATNNYDGATIGYAFVYNGNILQSCRSLYDTWGYPLGTSIKEANFKNTKDYYKSHKDTTLFPRYVGVFTDDKPQISDWDMIAFQRVCSEPQQPYYSSGPLDPVRVPYFDFQQFGYAVALSGQLGEWGTSLYVSAPGDTNRFMEDNDGKNYGRVYMWDLDLWIQPNNESLPVINFWDYSVFSPIIPPDLGKATYRAFGRDIAVGRSILAVSTYPLYENTREPFVIVYECKPELTTASHCEESPYRGVAIDDLPGNALGYLSSKMITYTDGKTRWSYIPSDVPNDQLDDFQNNFIGKRIGVTGSNVLIPDEKNKKIYRFGGDSESRETHKYLHNTNFGTNTEHWVLQSDQKLTHMWPCPRGTVAGKQYCNWGQESCITSKCVPCKLQYYSNDGWLADCDPCPRKFTTYEEGRTYCDPFVIPIPPGISWEDTRLIIVVIIASTIGTYLLCVVWQFACVKKRPKRTFNDKSIIV